MRGDVISCRFWQEITSPEPIAYLGQHGVSDNVLLIDLGRQLRDTFVENNGCQAQSPEDPAPGSGQHIKTNHSGCSADHPVVWIGFDGGHEPLPQGDAWTSQEIWKSGISSCSILKPAFSRAFNEGV